MVCTQRRYFTARFVAFLTAVSLLVSAFPASFFVAAAATPIPFTDSAQIDIFTSLNTGGDDLTTYENLVLSFDYDAEALDNGDSFTYGWVAGGVTTTEDTINGADEGVVGDESDSVSINLPVSAQTADFAFFAEVSANTGAPNDFVDLTNILLVGDEIPPACAPQVEDGLVSGPVQNTDTGEYFTTIQNAHDDCDTENGHTITVAAGTYTDDVSVTKELTFEGGTTAVVQAATVIRAGNVTFNEFTFDGGGNDPVLVRIPGTSNDVENITLTNNVFENMDITTNNDSAALTIESSSGTRVEGNTFRNLSTANGSFNRTMQGILIGDTGQSDAIDDVLIKDNTFDTISGGRGAYGMIVNRETTNLQVIGNTISNVVGNADSTGSGWASGIGLDADTPDAVVRNNTISAVTSLVNNFAGSFGIIGQTPTVAETILVELNDFLTPNAAENRTSGNVDFTRNWWGSPEGPKYVDLNTASNTNLLPAGGSVTQSVVGGSIAIDPWLCGPFASNPDESVAGTCVPADENKPTVSIVLPEDEDTLGPDFTVSGIAADAEGPITRVDFTVNEITALDGTFVAPFSSGTAQGTSTWEFAVVGATTGFYRVKVQAFDAAGNHKFDHHDIFVDAAKPMITMLEPNDGAILPKGTSTANGTAADAQGDIVEVRYVVKEITGIDGTVISTIERGIAQGTSTWSFVTPDLPVGTYRLIAQAFDEDGNRRGVQHDVTVVEPPEASLTILTPAADEVVYGTYDFTAEYLDDDETEDVIQWAIRAGTCAAGTNTVAGNVDGFTDSSTFVDGLFSTTLDTGLWSNGEYCFVVNPKEQSGEANLRATQYFTVMNNHTCEAGVNLVANPSFELDVVTAKRKWDLFDSITGWVVEKLGGGIAKAELQAGVFGWDSADGAQHAELGSNQQTQWSQTILTKPGEEYTLAWEYSPRPKTSKPESRMVVRVDGEKVARNNKKGKPDVSWKTHTYTFVATSSSVTISFEDTGTNNGKGPLLDNVSVVCNPPEPEMYVIEGYKWNDTDADGFWGDDELGIGGWTIYLSEGEVAQSTTTDSTGKYRFEVPAGYYEVYEEMRTGWIQTAPPSSFTFLTAVTEATTTESTYGSCTYMFGEDGYFLQDKRLGGLYNPEVCNFGNHFIEDDTGTTTSTTTDDGANSGSGNAGTRFSFSSDGPTPQVLGAATDAGFCPYLTDFMRLGQTNNIWEVTKLQLFLSMVFGADLAVTGIFDQPTDAAVRSFQAAYSDEVLVPWFNAGLAPNLDPTGYVYLTTQWKINDIVCPGYSAFPDLTTG